MAARKTLRGVCQREYLRTEQEMCGNGEKLTAASVDRRVATLCFPSADIEVKV